MVITFTFLSKSHEQRSCKRKVRYGHEATAIKATEQMARKYGKQYDIYECDYCDGWHIATSEGRDDDD